VSNSTFNNELGDLCSAAAVEEDNDEEGITDADVVGEEAACIYSRFSSIAEASAFVRSNDFELKQRCSFSFKCYKKMCVCIQWDVCVHTRMYVRILLPRSSLAFPTVRFLPVSAHTLSRSGSNSAVNVCRSYESSKCGVCMHEFAYRLKI